MPALLNPIEAEFWVGVGLVIFLAIALWKGRGALLGLLDAKAVRIRADLDEAARLRAEAERLLTQLRGEREEAERRSAQMQATRMEADARVKLEEQIARRAAAADRRIALAETQAAQAVKAAAAELAADIAHTVLAQRVAQGAPDPLIDRGIAQIGSKLQ